MVKVVTNNLMIVMLNLALMRLAPLSVVLSQILDSLLIQLQKHPVSRIQELSLFLIGLIGNLNVNFMVQIQISSQEK